MQGYHGRRGRRVPLYTSGSLGDDPATAPLTTTATSDPSVATPVPASASSLRDMLNGPNVSTVAAIALTYHGYKRTGSLIWALIYGLAGRQFPIEAVPVALAQGFGQKKSC